jgi:hypothetical protein
MAANLRGGTRCMLRRVKRISQPAVAVSIDSEVGLLVAET